MHQKKVSFPQIRRFPLREYREQLVAGVFSLQGFGADEPCIALFPSVGSAYFWGELALFLEDRGLVIALW